MKIEIKNLKSFEGREGVGFSCHVYIDGVKAFMARDEARGGCYSYDEFPGKRHLFEAFKAYCLAPERNPKGWCENHDTMLAEVIDKHETNVRLKRMCRTKTLIRKTPDDKDIFTFPVKFGPEVKMELLSRHPKAVFINESIAA